MKLSVGLALVATTSSVAASGGGECRNKHLLEAECDTYRRAVSANIPGGDLGMLRVAQPMALNNFVFCFMYYRP